MNRRGFFALVAGLFGAQNAELVRSIVRIAPEPFLPMGYLATMRYSLCEQMRTTMEYERAYDLAFLSGLQWDENQLMGRKIGSTIHVKMPERFRQPSQT